jgi:hypothetical protein
VTSLVLYAFAPLDGPAAPLALHQLQALWSACGEVLGMDAPTPGLPVTPPDWRGTRRVGALAARRRDDFRAVLRRDRDVLILSAALPGVGDAGWVELDRWLDDVAAGGVDALIGTARLYRMPTRDPSFPPSRAALPAFTTYQGWQDDRVRLGTGACAWEMSPRQDTRRERRLVLAGAELDALTWGVEDDRLPPLGRYLLHAAALRYHYRIWTGEQRRISSRRAARPGRDLLRADLARVHSMYAASTDSLALLSKAADEAGLRGDGGADPVTDDRDFGRWLAAQLEDACTSLENLLRADGGTPFTDPFAPPPAAPPPGAGSTRGPSPSREQPPPTPPSPAPPSSEPASPPPSRSRHALRLSFTIDAVGYSSNDAVGRELVQSRISHVVGEALGDLHLALTDTDHQGTGDGINVVLPPDLDLPRTLAQLLHGTTVALRADSGRYTAPLRLRMGASIGTFRVAALGWSDSTVIETNRLCDSTPLRAVMNERPDLLFAAMISDRLYPFTVGEDDARLASTAFTPTDVTVKAYQARAWLWVPETG